MAYLNGYKAYDIDTPERRKRLTEALMTAAPNYDPTLGRTTAQRGMGRISELLEPAGDKMFSGYSLPSDAIASGLSSSANDRLLNLMSAKSAWGGSKTDLNRLMSERSRKWDIEDFKNSLQKGWGDLVGEAEFAQEESAKERAATKENLIAKLRHQTKLSKAERKRQKEEAEQIGWDDVLSALPMLATLIF
jgi:hypothetical protein